jgi:hypothetical protein
LRIKSTFFGEELKSKTKPSLDKEAWFYRLFDKDLLFDKTLGIFFNTISSIKNIAPLHEIFYWDFTFGNL